MQHFDINRLDLKTAGMWPTPMKRAAYVVVAAMVVVLGWYFVLHPDQSALAAAVGKESVLRRSFVTKQARAADLVPMRAQLRRMKVLLSEQLRELPSKTEMPQLVIDVSQAAIATGLHTVLFKPDREDIKDFYAIKPIHIKMTGTYTEFGQFLSDVAALPRVLIMTAKDLSLKPIPDAGTLLIPSTSGAQGGVGAVHPSPMLMLQGTVETYRALDAHELAVQAAAKAAKAAAAAKGGKA